MMINLCDIGDFQKGFKMIINSRNTSEHSRYSTKYKNQSQCSLFCLYTNAGNHCSTTNEGTQNQSAAILYIKIFLPGVLAPLENVLQRFRGAKSFTFFALYKECFHFQ